MRRPSPGRQGGLSWSLTLDIGLYDAKELIADLGLLATPQMAGQDITLRVGHSGPGSTDVRVLAYLTEVLANGVGITIDGTPTAVSGWRQAIAGWQSGPDSWQATTARPDTRPPRNLHRVPDMEPKS